MKGIKEIQQTENKISVITCYDYSFAKAIDGNVDIILVGDSLGNVVLGYDKTKHVTMDDMVRHLSAVKRGAPNTPIVCDLPYGSYENKKDAVKNAKRLVEAGADAVKPEGKPDIVEILVKEGFEVMGHIGYLPQTQAVKKHKEEILIDEAMKIEDAGAFSVVLEMVDNDLAKKISDKLEIPTIGIGSGKGCDGQVLVLYDLLGLYPDFKPKFVKKYMNLKESVKEAICDYTKDVREGRFPE